VLGIVLPPLLHPSESQLWAALVSRWPDILAYALSFAVIGLMWQSHLAIFRLVARIDRLTVVLNLLLLAGAVFIPFATSTLGTYPTMHASTFLYGVVLTYCSIVNNVLLATLVGRRAFNANVGAEQIAGTIRAYRAALAVYALATLIALVYPIVSFAAYVGIVGFYLFPRGVDADLAGGNGSGGR
jgi:uncharacterized membrane protein